MNHPRIGVASIVLNDKGKILMGKRSGAHGDGTWSIPGGHLEKFETLADCARRETKEETGIEITNPKHVATTEDHFREIDKHYITIWMLSKLKSGQPKILEPEKFTEIKWHDWHKIPSPRFLPIDNLMAQGFILDPSIVNKD